jgi:hypothetical protein
MAVWEPTDVDQDPIIELRNWSVYETLDFKQRHFVGYDQTNYQGRVSSPIHFFNDMERYGITSTGRKYKLVGDCANISGPRFSEALDIEHTWRAWKTMTQVSEVKDVSEEYQR